MIEGQPEVGLLGAAMVSGLVQAVKMALKLEDSEWTRVLPLAVFILAIGWNALVLAQGGPVNWLQVVYLGSYTALAAMGLYNTGKTVRQ